MEDYNNQEDTPHHNTISHGANPAGVDDPPVTVIDSPPTASPGARPRARLSHLFGSKRIPREARAKSLTRSQKRQGPEASTHVQPPATVPNGEAHRARMIRRSASAPAVIPTRQPGPRYIGLEDRLAKVPLAIPRFVRKVDFKIPTDLTMATRGSGSYPMDSTTNLAGITRVERECGDTDGPSRPSGKMGTTVMPDEGKQEGVWSWIRRRAKAFFRRNGEKRETGRE